MSLRTESRGGTSYWLWVLGTDKLKAVYVAKRHNFFLFLKKKIFFKSLKEEMKTAPSTPIKPIFLWSVNNPWLQSTKFYSDPTIFMDLS